LFIWYFCVFGVFSPVCFKLSVPVQAVLERLVSEMTYRIMCRVGRKLYSLTHDWFIPFK